MNELNKMNISIDQPIILFLLNINANKLEISNNDEKTKRICIADNVKDIKKSFSKFSLFTNYLFKDEQLKVSKIYLSLFKSLLISVYIYFQNKNSPLMKFIHESSKDNNLSIIPFEYN